MDFIKLSGILNKLFLTVFFCVITFSVDTFSKTNDLADYSPTRTSFTMFRDFASGLSGFFEDFKASEYDVNVSNNDEDELLVQGFGTASYQSSASIFTVKNTAAYDGTPAQLVGDPLVYPNPFRQSSTQCSDDNTCARLVYELVQEGPIEIHFYDMLSNLIFQQQFAAGAMGAKVGQNQLILNADTFQFSVSGDRHYLSAGVYFYLIISEDTVIGKGKMVVKP